MSASFSLDTLPVGECALIERIHGEDSMSLRLHELGFGENSRVTCLFPSILGDPRAYRIKRTIIALRNSDAKRVICHQVKEWKNK